MSSFGMAPTILTVSQRDATWRSKSSSVRSNATKRPAKILRAPSPSSGSLCSTCNRAYSVLHAHSFVSKHPSSELDTLRTQTQTAQDESANAASQTAAVMSLNMKLQSSASKNQAKHIELEIKRLEARESKELLEIVQVCYFVAAY